MTQVYIQIGNIISSLGMDLEHNIHSQKANQCGIEYLENTGYSDEPFYGANVNDDILNSHFSEIGDTKKYTKCEMMLLLVISQLIKKYQINVSDEKTALIISTTKGNIDLLEKPNSNIDKNRVQLWEMTRVVGNYFKFANKPKIVSNACISGLLAIIIGARLIKAGKYENVIVCGVDVLSKFVISGFQSFKSLATSPCRPFDKNRDGLTLGEGAGALLLSSINHNSNNIIYKSGASSNDANHISGPSPTGEGLYIAIDKVLNEADNYEDGVSKPLFRNKIDYISAHGTATLYNDEMESCAIWRAGLENIPVNGLKGFWGHTLGAAGIIETIAGIKSMIDNKIYSTMGFTNPGVVKKMNIVKENLEVEINNFMKIASGFGGCNAAAVFSKV